MALSLGDRCPDFDLPGTDGLTHSLASLADAKLLVVLVSCNHCPYVVAYEERMVALSGRFRPAGVRFVAVNANDAVRYPDDDMAHMVERAKARGFDFPYLRDDPQTFVRALGARFTPEAFVFDAERRLRYHGRIDDNHRDAAAARSHDLANALSALLEGRTPPVEETQAVGCSVKWK
jgi:peroxiredoxin